MIVHSAVVTGATGYVGAFVTSSLRAHGWHVITLGRNDCDSIRADLSDPTSVLNASSPSATVDVCVHIAAAHEIVCADDPLLAMTINVTGTRALLEWCIAKKIKRFIYISTFHVFGSNIGKLTETTIPIPINDYGLTHRLAEEVVQMFSNRIESFILRSSNLIGIPHDWNSFDRWSLAQFDFCIQAFQSKKIVLRSSGKQVRNWVGMDILANAVIIAAEGKCNGIVHVCGNDLSVIDLAILISSVWQDVYHEKIEVVVPENSDATYEVNRVFTSSQHVDCMPDIASFVRHVGKHLRTSKTL